MTFNLNGGLAASILVGSALAPVAALAAQPAGASTQVCIDDQSYSLTKKSFPDNYNTAAGEALMTSEAGPWFSNGALSRDLSEDYFQNEATFVYAPVVIDGFGGTYYGHNNGVEVF